MSITDIEIVEDCFDGGGVFRYRMSKGWTSESIHRLSEMGKLEYFGSFPRPFFRLIGQGGYQVRGVEGEDTCVVVYPSKDKETIKQCFEGWFHPE